MGALLKAAHGCAHGVRWKSSVQMFEINKLLWVCNLKHQIENGTYKSKGFKRFDIMERGKLRHIQSVHISERTVQKTLVNNVIKPVVLPRLILDNTASQKGKGTDFALKRLREHLRWHYARYGTEGGILTMDFHDYFGSIDHGRAIEMINRYIDDPKLQHYVRYFIDIFDGDKGLGLGSEISQVVAIFFPNCIDRLVKEDFSIHCYGRYNDDSYVISNSLELLEEIDQSITELAGLIGIEVNPKKTKITPFANGNEFAFLKKRIYFSPTGKIVMQVSQKNIRARRQTIRMQREEYDAGRMPASSIWQSYQSWRGYAKKYNDSHIVHEMDLYFAKVMKGVDFK